MNQKPSKNVGIVIVIGFCVLLVIVVGGVVMLLFNQSQKNTNQQKSYQEIATQYIENTQDNVDAVAIFKNSNINELLLVLHHSDGSWTCKSELEVSSNPNHILCLSVLGPGLVDVFVDKFYVSTVYYQDGHLAYHPNDDYYFWYLQYDLTK